MLWFPRKRLIAVCLSFDYIKFIYAWILIFWSLIQKNDHSINWKHRKFHIHLRHEGFSVIPDYMLFVVWSFNTCFEVRLCKEVIVRIYYSINRCSLQPDTDRLAVYANARIVARIWYSTSITVPQFHTCIL